MHRKGLRIWPRQLRHQALLIMLVLAGADIATSVTSWILDLQVSDSRTRVEVAQEQEILLSKLSRYLSTQRNALISYEATGSALAMQPYTDATPQIETAEADLTHGATPQSRPLVETSLTRAGAWQTWAEAVRKRVAAEGRLLDPVLDAQGKALYDEQRTANQGARDASQKDAQTFQAETDRLRNVRRMEQVVALLFGLTMLGVLGYVFTRSALGPLLRLVKTAERLARGERVKVIGAEREDEVGSLAEALAEWGRAQEERELVVSGIVEISREVEIEDILSLATSRLLEVLAADQVVVALLEGDAWRIVVAAPDPFELDASAVVLTSTATSRSLQELQPVLGATNDEDLSPEFRDWAKEHGLGTALALPLVTSGRLLGIAAVYRRLGRPAFVPLDIRRSEMIVPQIAAAIQVASLFEEVRSANRHKSDFLASMSHELRTPLNSILGFSQMLLENPQMATESARRERYLANILSSGRHLLGLINDVLDMSKVEAGRMELVFRSLHLEEEVSAAVATMAPLAQAKGLRLTSECLGEVVVWADSTRLKQILLNLISNAIKFTPEGGTVTVGGRLIGDTVRIDIRDSGIGITAEERPKVFEAFQQLEAGRARGSEGTGLGLALVKRFVELHGGTIEVESEVGQGSTFIVTLPTAPVGLDQSIVERGTKSSEPILAA